MLSSSFLAWWWFTCVWPHILLPSLPLMISGLLVVLRNKRWRHAMLFRHETTAPLTYEGFLRVVSWNQSTRVATWLERFVDESLQAKVVDRHSLHTFAALTFRQGKPIPDLRSIESLDKALRMQNFVSWSHFPHHMDGHKPTDPQEHQPAWTRLPAFFVPDELQYWIRKYQHPLEVKKTQIFHVLELASILLKDDEKGARAAGRVYVGLVIIALVLALVRWLIDITGHFFRNVVHISKIVFWGIAGTVLVCWGLPRSQVFRTYISATTHTREYQWRRSRGGCAKHWAFFTPDSAFQL